MHIMTPQLPQIASLCRLMLSLLEMGHRTAAPRGRSGCSAA